MNIHPMKFPLDMLRRRKRLKGEEGVAFPQTSFGVRLSRIHFSPTVRGGEMNA